AGAVLGLMAAVVVLGVTTWRISVAEARTRSANEDLKEEQAQREAAYEELQKEQGRTQAALKQEAAQRARAERNYRQAREVLDFLKGRAVEEMAGKPQMQELRRRLLAKLLDYYQAFIAKHGEASVADELLDAQVQVAELLVEVGRKADALAAFENAMRDRERHWPGPPPGRPGGCPGGPPRGIARLFLLGQPAVQRDLKLSAQEAEQIKAMLDFRGRPPSNEEVVAAEKGLTAMLRSDQSERLEQIICQTRGPQGLLDPETAQALRLTERQKEQIQAVLEKARPGPCPRDEHRDSGRYRGPGGPRGKGGPRPRPGGPSAMLGPKRVEEQGLRVVNVEQRATWRMRLGKPFRGDIRVGPRPQQPRPRGATTYVYYEGTWDRLPDFDKLVPADSGTGPAFDLGQARRRE